MQCLLYLIGHGIMFARTSLMALKQLSVDECKDAPLVAVCWALRPPTTVVRVAK